LTGCTFIPTTDASWATVDPASAGWDPTKLEAALTFAGEHATWGLAILLDGKILAERYWGKNRSWQTDVFSVQKSVSALLTIIAQEKGLLDFDTRVSTYLGSGWTNATTAQEASITVRHLLTMSSGLKDDLTRSTAPNGEWRYNSNAYYCLNKVLAKVANLPMDTLCREWLTDRIGCSHNHWAPRGATVDPKGAPIEAFQSSVLDLARIGLLVHQGGSWSGTQVVPSAALDAALTQSQSRNPSYGHLWWLNGQSSYIDPAGTTFTGPIFPSAPADLRCALGFGDQKIYVSRAKKLVVVRLGEKGSTDPASSVGGFDNPFWQRLTAAMP
jgi:CubicO group peptidase (beta-lactamase class C family)